jgi:hypothetical protein
MNVTLLIKSSVIVGLFALVAWFIAPSALAADDPAGSGTPSQKEEINTDTSQAQETGSQPRQEDPSAGEVGTESGLGKDLERPMKAPETTGLDSLEEIIREQDQKAAIAF